ncbi:uncharacterized protein LOC127837324 [Dreissena polymorpha]|uniref:uncharacterized protein LOC127837324 n=1 Tax=Dreissena polymorpha TaxID=45954 RepID=UPI0022643920|nr:uncharacterized protein LOC127837324 [Dreissena polymorpha]
MDAQVLFGVVLIAAGFIADVHGLSCYICERQETYEGCTAHITTCADDQECFMDELVTATNVYYSAGCRSKGICLASGTGVGKRTVAKRQDIELRSCSRCCSSSNFCNGLLCGINSGVNNTGYQRCYYCENTHDQNDCNNIVTCDQDQVCGTHVGIAPGGRFVFNYNCQPKRQCVAATQFIVEHYRDQLIQATVGKRTTASCNICCGDTLCNFGSCTEQARKMALLLNNQTFDLSTLTRIP